MRKEKFTWLLVLIAVVMLADRVGRPILLRWLSPVDGARWIWAPDLELHTTPRAFYAIRDFEIDELPTRAELLIQADAEYLLLVNGERVGLNRYSPSAPLDRYEVSRFLRSGPNRIAVELRTRRGIGGLLCHLEIGADPVRRIVSDERWLIEQRHRPRILRGAPLESTVQRAMVWGMSPTGRWGWPKIGPIRPDLKSLTSRKRSFPARRVTAGLEKAAWAKGRRSKKKSPAIGSAVTFDWKKVVQGYIELKLADREYAGALLFIGKKRPDPLKDQPVNVVVSIPGRKSWIDSQPRRFRYVTVVGASDLTGAELLKLDEERYLQYQARGEPSGGVYGIEGPQLRSTMENKLWRQIHGLSSQRVGEEP